MPPHCSRCARWLTCTCRGKNCCSWHRLSPGAKVADHGRAAQAGGRPEKTESERLHRPSRTLTTSKTRAYSEFPLGVPYPRSLAELGFCCFVLAADSDAPPT